MTTKRFFVVATCAALGIAGGMLEQSPSSAQSGRPRYEVDPSWPKPLPDRWVLGGLGARGRR